MAEKMEENGNDDGLKEEEEEEEEEEIEQLRQQHEEEELHDIDGDEHNPSIESFGLLGESSSEQISQKNKKYKTKEKVKEIGEKRKMMRKNSKVKGVLLIDSSSEGSERSERGRGNQQKNQSNLEMIEMEEVYGMGGTSESLESNPKTPLSPKPSIKMTQNKTFNLISQYQYYFSQSKLEIKKNKCQFCLGCFSIFLVVFVVAISMSLLHYSPILFLGIAETEYGEVDLSLVSSGSHGMNFLNYTSIEQRLSSAMDDELNYHSPRAAMPTQTYRASNCHGWSPSNPSSSSWTYEVDPSIQDSADPRCKNQRTLCVNYNCDFGTRVGLILIDTEREKKAQLGRSWTHPTIPEGECLIFNDVANYLGVNVGEYIVISFFWNETFPWHYQTTLKEFPNATDSGYINLMLKINQIISSSERKWNERAIYGLVLEYKTIISSISTHLTPLVNDTYRNFVKNLNPYESVSNVVLNLPPPRYPYYQSSTFAENAKVVVEWASKIIYLIGFNQVYDSLPVLVGADENKLASSMLGLILNLVILLLSGISILLIYSLLMISVESRTFEMGVVRMLGLPRSNLIQLLLVHALFFAVPAWALGLTFGQLIFFFTSKVVTSLTDIPISPLLTTNAILVSTALGLLIPLISSIFPIRNALTHNLHDSLDTNRSKTKAVMITVERSSVNQDLLPMLFIGFLLTLFGFLIYYVLPLALISLDAALLFNIFLAIMMGMLIGLVILALNIQPLFESALLWTIFRMFFFENQSLEGVVGKNLIAHRLRNRKTAITYSISLGFIIFLSVAMAVELRTLIFMEYSNQGSQLRVSIWQVNSEGVPLGISKVPELEEWANKNPYIDDYAWISHHLRDLSPYRSRVVMSNIGGYISDTTNIYAVSPNLFDVVEPGYFELSMSDASSVFSGSEQLYTIKGFTGLITGEYYRTRLNLNSLEKEFVVEIQTETTPLPTIKRTVVTPIALARSSAILTFTYFPDNTQDAIISFPTFLNLSDGQFSSVLDIPMRYFIIKLKDDITNEQFDEVVRSMPSLVNGENVDDIRRKFNGLVKQQLSIKLLFQLITMFTMAISFFSLNSSMYTNIMEQSKEIGILRALGLKRLAIYRIYTYEAFVLVFSSSLLGGLIGTVIGWSMSAQRALFTQVPLNFSFPWDIALTVILISIICAFLSTFLPVMRLMKLDVVDIFRLK